MNWINGFELLCYAITILFGVAVIVYMGFHLAEQFSPDLELTDAVLTTHTQTVHADAMILREETPLYVTSYVQLRLHPDERNIQHPCGSPHTPGCLRHRIRRCLADRER